MVYISAYTWLDQIRVTVSYADVVNGEAVTTKLGEAVAPLPPASYGRYPHDEVAMAAEMALDIAYGEPRL